DQLELAAVDPAAGVDLLEREFHAFLVGLEKGGEHLVAIQLADLHALGKHQSREQRQEQNQSSHFSTFAPRSGRMRSVPPGKARQNSLRTRLTIVALLLRPWYRATTSSISRSRGVAEKVVTLALTLTIYKSYIRLV